MINRGEAESRAVTGAVRGAIGQARLDAGVNITGLLVDIGSAESVDYRQHFMCWQLTRVLRPSLSEKVTPAVVRSVVKQDTARSRTGFLSDRSWGAGSPLSDLGGMHLHREVPAASTGSSDDTGVVGDTAGAGLPHPRPGQATSETRRSGYARDCIIPSPSGFADTRNVSPHQELCRTTQRACV
jgi:hypothetical protein